MLTLEEIRQYISGLGIAEDSRVYIGKLDNKQQKAIGIYNRKRDGPVRMALGGVEYESYGIRPISLLVHWNTSVSESERAAYRLYEMLKRERTEFLLGETEVRFLALQTPQPVDVGTDENGVYESVIWVDFVFQRK